MLYDSGRFRFSKKRKTNIERRKQLAQQHYDEWHERAERFYAHFQYDLEKKWYNEALFELHQTIKCLYTAILLVFGDYVPQDCDLEKLGRYVASYEPAFLTVFPCTTDRQDQIVKLLNCSQPRDCNAGSFRITKVDLTHLEQSVRKLMALTQETCRKKIDSIA